MAPRRHWLAVLVLVLTPARALAADSCQLYDGSAGWTGPSSNIYINTYLWACISDADGNCSSTGGYLDLENLGNNDVYWSSLAGGQGGFSLLAPQQKYVKYLPIYRGPNDPPLQVDLQVNDCPPLTDRTSLASGTPIKTAHITELRDRVNMSRTQVGLSAYPWTDPTLVAKTSPIKAQHITELRTAISEIYTNAGAAAPVFTDPALGAGMPIKAVHIIELRAAMAAVP